MTRRAAILAVVALVALPHLPAAGGGTGCTAIGTTLMVTMDTGGTYILDIDPATGFFRFNTGVVSLCTGGSPTPIGIDEIDVIGGGADENFEISFANGAFAPGATLAGESADSKPEIEIDVDLGAGTNELRIRGRQKKDVIHIGRNTILSSDPLMNTNNDDDVDIATFDGIDLIRVFSEGGDDIILATTTRFAYATPVPVQVDAGPGNDRVVGTSSNESLYGESGADKIKGMGGADILDGGGGPDRLNAADGEADDTIDCGGGNDFAKLDAGIDPAPIGCEEKKKV